MVCPLASLVINLESKSLGGRGDVLAYKGLPCAYHGQTTSPSSGQVNTHTYEQIDVLAVLHGVTMQQQGVSLMCLLL